VQKGVFDALSRIASSTGCLGNLINQPAINGWTTDETTIRLSLPRPRPRRGGEGALQARRIPEIRDCARICGFR